MDVKNLFRSSGVVVVGRRFSELKEQLNQAQVVKLVDTPS